MWVFFRDGFISAVLQDANTNTMKVRARDRESLEALIRDGYLPSDTAIVPTNTTDYPYRVYVSKADWAKAVYMIANDIDYTNYKDAIKKRGHHILYTALNKVWHVMWDFGYSIAHPEKQKTQQYKQPSLPLLDGDRSQGTGLRSREEVIDGKIVRRRPAGQPKKD